MFTGAAELPVYVRLDSRAENLPHCDVVPSKPWAGSLE